MLLLWDLMAAMGLLILAVFAVGLVTALIFKLGVLGRDDD